MSCKKSNYLLEPSFEPAGPSKQAEQDRTSGRSKTTPSSHSATPKNQVTLSDTDEDNEFDRAPMKKFPIGAHLPLKNIPYELQKVKRSFLADNPQNDIADIRKKNAYVGLQNKKNKG